MNTKVNDLSVLPHCVIGPDSACNCILAEKAGVQRIEDDYKVQLVHPQLHLLKRKSVSGSVRKQNFDHLDVCFTRSNRGNNLLTIDGKPFTLNRRIKDACYWECVKLRCKYIKCTARVVTKSNQISALRGHHNHQ